MFGAFTQDNNLVVAAISKGKVKRILSQMDLDPLDFNIRPLEDKGV